MAASLWGAGSIALVGWSDLALAVPVLALCGALTACVVPPLRQLELGDDAAHAHGVRTEPVRLAVLFAGVALIAIVTALTGPIAFIALAAPQITKRLTRGAGIPVGASAFTGALLLLGADLVAQHVLPGSVPVGVVTVVIGGLYLIALLVQEARAQL
jgi:iron complex transport system permease protein